MERLNITSTNLCVIGLVGMVVNPGLYRRLVERRRRKIAPEILKLTEELKEE